MTAAKARFDGNTIEVPEQLRGAPPGEVVVLFEDRRASATETGGSIWDLFGGADHLRSADSIDAQLLEEREGWEKT